MKIGAISDLHIDRHPKLNAQHYLDTLVDVVIKKRDRITRHWWVTFQMIIDK